MASEVCHANDLLQSPPAPRAAHRPSIVTVDDIRVDALTCWICQVGTDDLDSDTEDEVVERPESGVSNASKGSKGRRKLAGRNRRFVHACNCTLVAHERCLLHWINRKSTPAQPAVKCPQCAHPYRIVSPPPTLLSIFERANSHLPRVVWTGIAALTGTAVGYVCYGYGRLMLRAWMGREAAEKFAEGRAGLLTSDLVLLPIGLVLSRLPANKLDTEVCLFTALWCLPTWLDAANRITASSLSSLPSWTSQADSSRYANIASIGSSAESDFLTRCLSWVFPPGPVTCLHFLSWIARLYRSERDRLRARLFEPLVQRARLISGQEPPRSTSASAGQRSGAAPQQAGPRLPHTQRTRTHHRRPTGYTRIVVLGPGEPHHIDTDDQAQPPPLGTEAFVDANSTETAAVSLGQAPYGTPSPSRVMYVSPLSIARLFLTALGTPFAASATGWALQQVAMWLKPGNWLERFLAISAFRKLPTAFTAAEAAARAAASSSTTAMYHGVPSLHWRNTVGLGVWVAASDVVSTIYRYLRLRRRTKLTVQDRPFVGAIVDSLELKGYDEAA